MSVLFIQKRPIRAGAQTSLARLAASLPLRALKPVVLLGGAGWLNERIQRFGGTVLFTPFPSPRSLFGRLAGMRFFAKRVAALVESNSLKVDAIIANDHQECPLALALSGELGKIPVLGVMRSHSMSRCDFDKYGCNRCDGLMGVGTELQERLRKWTSRNVALFSEGFEDGDFGSPRPRPAACPRRILVIGSQAPGKGFADFVEALDRFEKRVPEFPGFECDFTGDPPRGVTAGPARGSFRFIGRVDDFRGLVESYELAVHPSRGETFGLAPIEAMLAGTPVLVSLTGIAGDLALPDPWVFPPGDATALSDRLEGVWRRWPVLDLAKLQARVRLRHHIDDTAAAMIRELSKLTAERAL